MKKIFIVFLLSFLLVSCFGGDNKEEKSGKSIQTKYNGADFSMLIPAKWNILKDTGKILPKPASGEIVFDAVSQIANDGFYRNLLVLKQELEDKSINSLDFIVGNYLGSKKEYFYIKDLGYKNVKIDSKNTRIYDFEARYSEDTPIVKFIQTGIICGNNGYLLTITLEKSNKNLDRYERLLGTFSCKKDIKKFKNK